MAPEGRACQTAGAVDWRIATRHHPRVTDSAARFLVLAVLCVPVFAVAMVAPWHHDEDQYVAAGALARELGLYADFVFLQPPLYPLVLAVLYGLFDGQHLLAARLLTFAFAAGSIALLLRLLTRLGAGLALATLLTVLVLLSPFVVWPLASARNDAMPFFLLLAGVVLYLDVGAPRVGLRLLAVGALLGAAACTKVSYAFAPAIVGLHLLAVTRRGDLPRRIAWFVLGLGAAAAPAVWYLAVATEGFLYGVVTYHLTAPIAWYSWEGRAAELGVAHRLVVLAQLLGTGTNLALLLVLAWAGVCAAVRRGPSPAGLPARSGLLMGALAAGALLFGFLPSPSWPMYFAPVAPFLAACAALWVARARAAPDGPSRLLASGVVIAALPGAPSVLVWIAALAALPSLDRWTGMRATQTAAAVAEAMRATGAEGQVATLYPAHVIDAARVPAIFASGPFFYRTGDLLPPARIHRLRGVSPATLDKVLDADPPAAVFGGFERGFSARMDRRLLEWAARQGYVEVPLGPGAPEEVRLLVRRRAD